MTTTKTGNILKKQRKAKQRKESRFMDPTREEVEIPMPLNSAYPRTHVHVSNMLFNQYHYHDHDHHHEPSNGQFMPITLNHHHHNHHHQSKHQVIKYRECLKNHAASKGGNIRDGCGEFMPSGEEEDTIEALICSVCNCHRNFHRKEVEGETTLLMINNNSNNKGRKVIELGHHKNMNMLSPAGINGVAAGGGGVRGRGVPIIPYNMGSLLVYSDQSDGQDEVGGGGTVTASPGVAYMGFPPPPSSQHHTHILRKRFRTKFTPEQKEKMFNFAEKVGWTIQKQEESQLQLFCQEIGVKRKVLKVWMHNNKHNINKKASLTTDACQE
ncbi:hypothetical protein V2J09_007465 [Rumex salicifolius]